MLLDLVLVFGDRKVGSSHDCWLCDGEVQHGEGRNKAEGRITGRTNTGLIRDLLRKNPLAQGSGEKSSSTG